MEHLHTNSESNIDAVSIDQYFGYLTLCFKKCIEHHPALEISFGDTLINYIVQNYSLSNDQLRNLLHNNNHEILPQINYQEQMIIETNKQLPNNILTHHKSITLSLLTIASYSKCVIGKPVNWEKILEMLLIDKNEDIQVGALKTLALSNNTIGTYFNELLEFCQDNTYRNALNSHPITEDSNWLKNEHRLVQYLYRKYYALCLPCSSQKLERKKGK